MDSNLLIVSIIALLYKESLLQDKDNSADLATEVIQTIKIPETFIEGDKSRDITISLRQTALWMINNSKGHIYEKSAFLQRIRVNTHNDSSLYAAVEDGINVNEDDHQRLQGSILHHQQHLRNYLREQKIEEILLVAQRELILRRDMIDLKSFAKDIYFKLEPFISSDGMAKIPGMIDEVDFSDEVMLAQMYREALGELSLDGVLKTGWQGMNRLLGCNLGFRRGEFVVLGALQHKFKSGFCLSLFRQLPLFNIPYMRDVKRKPLILRISLENNSKDDAAWLYKSLKELETGEYCDTRKLDPEEASKYVNQRLTVNGYHVRQARFNPSEFTFMHLFSYVDRLESEGYEIHHMQVDYLAMMNPEGCTMTHTGSQIRDLYRRVRNFMVKRYINFLTPHQLSSEAKALVRNGVENFVQFIAEKGYYDGCKGLDQEVDLEIYIHIEKIGDESYLTVQRGKHRGLVDMTPEKDKYFVMKFEPIGTLPDDINGKDLSRRHVAGATVSDGGGRPWFNEVEY